MHFEVQLNVMEFLDFRLSADLPGGTFRAGQRLDVYDDHPRVRKFLEAKVVDVREASGTGSAVGGDGIGTVGGSDASVGEVTIEVKIHYMKYSENFDTW